MIYLLVEFSSVQFSCSIMSYSLWSPWTAAHQASLSKTNTWSLLKLMSIMLVMPSNHLFLCRPLLILLSICPRIAVSQFFTSGGQNIGVSASASVLPMDLQDWSPLGWTGWISLQSKGLSRVFSQHHSSKASILQHSALVELVHAKWTMKGRDRTPPGSYLVQIRNPGINQGLINKNSMGILYLKTAYWAILNWKYNQIRKILICYYLCS